MINKKIIENARQQFKTETTKLVNELTKKHEKTATPSSPLKPNDIVEKQKQFRDLVAKLVEQFSKNNEYLNYLGTAQEDTITA